MLITAAIWWTLAGDVHCRQVVDKYFYRGSVCVLFFIERGVIIVIIGLVSGGTWQLGILHHGDH